VEIKEQSKDDQQQGQGKDGEGKSEAKQEGKK